MLWILMLVLNEFWMLIMIGICKNIFLSYFEKFIFCGKINIGNVFYKG